MKLNKTDVLILNAIARNYGPQTVSDLYRDLPAGLFSARNALSARLCEMRKRGLLRSATLDSGVNEWQLSEAGSLVVAGQKNLGPDAAIDAGIPATEPNDPEIPDSSPDPIAADFAAAIKAADEVVAAELPDFGGNPLFCVDATGICHRPPWRGCSDESGPDEVSDDLIEEADALRLRRQIPREHDALYVLSVLIDLLGRDSPAIAYELTRVAAYIEGEYA